MLLPNFVCSHSHLTWSWESDIWQTQKQRERNEQKKRTRKCWKMKRIRQHEGTKFQKSSSQQTKSKHLSPDNPRNKNEKMFGTEDVDNKGSFPERAPPSIFIYLLSFYIYFSFSLCVFVRRLSKAFHRQICDEMALFRCHLRRYNHHCSNPNRNTCFNWFVICENDKNKQKIVSPIRKTFQLCLTVLFILSPTKELLAWIRLPSGRPRREQCDQLKVAKLL